MSDDALVELMLDERLAKVGIDAPFGWPLAFIDAVATYRDEGRWLELDANEVRFRATEIRIFEETNPVAAERRDSAISAGRRRVARGCCRASSHPKSSCGEGIPAATSSCLTELDRGSRSRSTRWPPSGRWGFVAAGSAAATRSYKGGEPGRRQRRAQYLTAMREDLPIEMSAADYERCTDDDDEFDALISAVVARAAQLRLTDPIPPGQAWLAMREGWIHLPLRDSLHQLASQAQPQP